MNVELGKIHGRGIGTYDEALVFIQRLRMREVGLWACRRAGGFGDEAGLYGDGIRGCTCGRE